MPRIRYVVTKLEYNEMLDTLTVEVIDICNDIEESKKLIDCQALPYYRVTSFVEEDSSVCLRLADTCGTGFVEFEYHPIVDDD